MESIKGWRGIYTVVENAEPYERVLPETPMNLRGVVSSGLGRAHIFMAQKHYQNQFKKILENSAWPGTLNVDLFDNSIDNYKILRISAGLEEGDPIEFPEALRINGFERNGESFGGATAFRARISNDAQNWIECAILIPDLTRHIKTAEVISASFLRESIPCEDGDEIYVTLI